MGTSNDVESPGVDVAVGCKLVTLGEVVLGVEAADFLAKLAGLGPGSGMDFFLAFFGFV